MTALKAYIDWMNAHLGFNPRSQANSNALSDLVTADLKNLCKKIGADVSRDVISAHKNADVFTKVACRNVDLVFREGEREARVRLAIENKTIMAAHGKARKNRCGDIIAYSNHVHNHSRESIAAAIVIVNCSAAYENPDGFAKGLVRPRFDMRKVVRDTVKLFTDIPLRSSPEEPNDQPEALAVVVVDYDGVHPAKLVGSAEEFALHGASNHYDNFIAKICDLYSRRFGK